MESKKSTAKNPLASMASRKRRLANTISNQGAPCSICGSYENVQMHHMRALKDIDKSENAVHKHRKDIQRKQIPVCRINKLALNKGNGSNKPSK